MSYRVTRKPAAEADLTALWQYIANDSETAADRLLDRIEHVSKLLADDPMAGRARPEISTGLRSFPVGNYIVYYRITSGEIVLTRVLSGYRDVEDMDFE